MKKVDALIIGAGPAGKTAAIYLSRAGYKPLVLTGINNAGGALMNTTEIENFPGFPNGIAGPELMSLQQEQAEKFGAEFEMDEAVKITLTDKEKVVETMMDETYSADAVILALGSVYRKLNVKGELEYSGKGVSYCATCDGFFFKDKELVVVGGGDTAIEEALYLTHFASKVTLVHRRDEFRASKIMEERLRNCDKIELELNKTVEEIVGDEKSVQKVILKDTQTGDLSELNCQGVFVAIGCDPSTQILDGQIELDENNYILVDNPTSKTNINGVFAAGDCIDPNYRQAIVAAGSGAKAGIDCERFLEELNA